MSKMKLLLEVVQDMRHLADSLQAVAEAMMQNDTQEPAPEETQTPAAPVAKPSKKVTLEQVRAVLAQKSHDGMTAEVRALLQKYGASKLSAIDPECYEALLLEAEELTNAS